MHLFAFLGSSILSPYPSQFNILVQISFSIFCHPISTPKACAGIIFICGVQLCRGVGDSKKILSGLYLGNQKVQKRLWTYWGTLVGGFGCTTLWCDLDVTFDLVVVIFAFKILYGLYLRTVRCRTFIFGQVLDFRM